MTQTPLGRLEKITDLRTVWNGEASDFTPWLAQEENLKLLGETIGLDLDLDQQEKAVGPFRADIVCKETITDTWVLVENQLERTDHNHLGQLLTYAAGLDAVTIVWIADRFTDEHRAALDWLNEITGDDINFFGLEIELWRIGNSAIAPKFNMVSMPNEWVKTITANRRGDRGEISPTQQFQLEYWQALVRRLEDTGSFLRTRKPRAQRWLNTGIGRGGFVISAFANTRDNRIGIQLVIQKEDAKAYFHLLQQEKESIEGEIGDELEWRELPTKQRSIITLHKKDFDPNLRSQWTQQHAWLQEKLEAFYKCFAQRVKELDAADYYPPDEDGDDEQ